MIEKCKRVYVTAPTIVDYQTFGDPNAKEVVLLLHGFGQNSDEISQSLEQLISDDYYWIVPNGSFPMPKQRRDEVLYRFSWYFYNTFSKSYYIDFSYPTFVLSSFLENLDPSKRPLTIIGYSQGGYLAPFVGQSIEQTKMVIGISCTYRHDMLENTYGFDLYAIHGNKDVIVEYENSKRSYDEMKELISVGEYITIDGGTHTLDNSFISAIKKLI